VARGSRRLVVNDGYATPMRGKVSDLPGHKSAALPQKAILNWLEANKALGIEPLAVASGIKTQAEI